MVGTQFGMLAHLGKSEIIEISPLANPTHRPRHRVGAVGKGITLQPQILLGDVGICRRWVKASFLCCVRPAIFRQIFPKFAYGFRPPVAKHGGFIGITPNQHRNMQLAAFRKDLRRLLRDHPTVDDGPETHAIIFALGFKNLVGGNSPEIRRQLAVVGNPQVFRQQLARLFPGPVDGVVRDRGTNVFVEDALTLPAFQDCGPKQMCRHRRCH
jgi:hypothetical protein